MVRKRRTKLKPIMKILVFILIAIIVVLLCVPNKNTSNKEKTNAIVNTNKISLIMTGDVLIHSSVYDDAYEDGKYNFDKMLSLVKPIVKEHDLAFYNQETILGGTSLGLSSYPAFNSPQEVGEAFTSAGFNLVSLANNHTLDIGKKGVISSNNYWKTKKDVFTSGSYNTKKEKELIKTKEINGIKYTLLSYTTTTNGIIPTNDYYVNIYSEDQVRRDIEAVKDKVDLLLVSMHWGQEYSMEITKEQENIANYLSSMGVDIIIGHHPHVIEPIDYINDTLVIYSLGNFLSGQEGLDRRIGMMVSVNITKENNDIMINVPKVTLTYNYYNDGDTKTNFKIYPFNKLNNNILTGYQKYYRDYMKIISSKTNKQIEFEPI